MLSASRKDAKLRFFSVRLANDVPCSPLHIETGLITVSYLRRLICEIIFNQKNFEAIKPGVSISRSLPVSFQEVVTFVILPKGFAKQKSETICPQGL